jgi:hypothetical protein
MDKATPARPTTPLSCLGTDWFDPLEEAVRGQVRAFIERLLEEELGALPGRRAVLPGIHAPPSTAERGKKRMRALCRWHFQRGGGPEYCRACREDGLPCARGEPGAGGRLCPYREHDLISRQEHEAWEVLLTCQGQVRLSPSGHVVGVDMDAALKIGAARGHELAVLTELLPAAEAGLFEALSTAGGQSDRP